MKELSRLQTITISAVDQEVELKFNTLNEMDTVESISVYTEKTYAANKSLEFVKPLMIETREVFPVGFETHFLFAPALSTAIWREVNAPAKGSYVTATLKCTDTTASYPFDAYFVIKYKNNA